MEDFLLPVGIGDLEELRGLAALEHRIQRGRDHLVDGRGDAAVPSRVRRRDGEVGRQVLLEDVAGGRAIGPVDLDLHVEAAGPQDRGIDQVRPVGGADDHDVAEPFNAVDLGEELRDDRRLDVRGDAGPARPEERVHLVEEDHHGHVVGRLVLGLLKDLADLPLGLADILVQQLRPLHVEEVRGDLFAALLRDLLGEQHAPGRAELVVLVVVGVEVRQLHRILDRLDLQAQTADVAIPDVGHLFESKLFGLALRQALEEVSRFRIHQDVVTRLQLNRTERIGDDSDLLVVRAQRDDGAVVV